MTEEQKTSATLFDIREILRQKISQDNANFEGNVKVIKALTLGVDSSTSPAVAGRDKYVWVREFGMNGAVYQAFSPDRIPMVVNLPVLLMYGPKEPFRWQVYGSDWAELLHLPDYNDEDFGVGAHSPNQEWPDYAASYDPLNIYPRALVPLRTYSGTSGLLISVAGHRYIRNREVITYYGELDIDLSSYQPAVGHAKLVVIYLNKATNAVEMVVGEVRPYGSVLPPYPTIPGESIVSAAVRLYGGQTVIVEADITDLRMHLTDTEALELLNALASVETELDYELSNHELRIDGLGSDLAGEIESLEDFSRNQLALVESERDIEQSIIVTTRSPFEAVPLAISTVLSWPNLKMFIPPGPLYNDGSNWFFTNLADSTEYFTQVSRPEVRLLNGWRPQVGFDGGDDWAWNSDKANWDIKGDETTLHADWRGLTVWSWVWFDTAASAVEYIITKGYGATELSYSLNRKADGTGRFFISDNSTTVYDATSSDTIGSGKWVFMAGRFNPSTEVKLWLNKETYTNITSIPATINDGVAHLFIAGRDDATTPGQLLFDGSMSMFGLCGAYLPDATIDNFYNLTKGIYDNLWTP